ncbi:hypothetical protein BS78_02G022900 [Paspalum vaginatum]|nr:hypothetical protein BS78_02G022900 [Paspalum vaginatum]
MVAAIGGAEHGGAAEHPVDVGLGHGSAVAGDRVPDDVGRVEAPRHPDEHAAVAAGERVGGVGHRRGGDEAFVGASWVPGDEAEERWGSVEGAVAAEEGAVAEGAEPRLADERGAEEVLGLVGREAAEDLADEVVHQLRWWWWWRRRRHVGIPIFGGGGGGTAVHLVWNTHQVRE